MTDTYLRAHAEVIQLHKDADLYADDVLAMVLRKEGTLPNDSGARAVLVSQTTDLLACHRAVLALCKSGWAFCSASLLRTMIDLLLCFFVIVENPKEIEYHAFKYTMFSRKQLMHDERLTDEQRQRARAEIKKAITFLRQEDKARAQEFMFQQRLQGYWHAPEYKSPSMIIDALGSEDIKLLYQRFSGGAHGGFIGMRLHKDAPQDIHANPRGDQLAQDMGLSASSRILLETFGIWDSIQNQGAFQSVFDGVMERFWALKNILTPARS